ncbi:MAG TPA: hypothetical protein VFC78_24015 [Tepidisphaeraceae bacterium]|nr:hypothetical protein [Tepidisphaeraceae bacterium]
MTLMLEMPITVPPPSIAKMPVSANLPAPAHSCTPAPCHTSAHGAMLMRVLAALDDAQIPYCILHGYEQYPRCVSSDVDLLIPASFLPDGLARVLHDRRDEIGGRVVQWFDDGAHFIVLAGGDRDGPPVLLQLHVSPRYEMAGRVFFEADDILANRRRANGFWAPATDIEFACVLANKVSKGRLSDEHGRRLSALFAIAPEECHAQAARLLGEVSARLIATAAERGNWHPVQRSVAPLREQLLRGPAKPAGGNAHRIIRKALRWIRPRNGFHVVFLGPDGVGKSTTIESFQRDLSPAFLHTIYLTFAPGLLPQKFAPPKPDGPHSLPPRSLPASLLKAAWWAVCYTAGYYASVHPTRARAGLVVNHRYLVDAIVDQKRYRYSGPVWLLKLIWAIAPKPDVVILLDAAPEIIQRRKQEVPFEETARQVSAYRGAIGGLSIGRIIDATQPLQSVAANVEWLVLDMLARRIARRFGHGGAK